MNLTEELRDFTLMETPNLLVPQSSTKIETFTIDAHSVTRFTNEFWTAKQRQASSLHEISYRACYKPQLPRFFITRLTKEGDTVYDPFSGRGTTAIEAGLYKRKVIANDINPLSKLLSQPRFFIQSLPNLEERLSVIPIDLSLKADIDLSMFYHQKTEAEIVSLQHYLKERRLWGKEDDLDAWIRMVATNRLTGHSSGFFSVYSLPPNQAVTAENQRKINDRLQQKPEYRSVKAIIIKKSKSLLRDISALDSKHLKDAGETAQFLTEDARETSQIQNNSVQLIVTSPPFLDIVDYTVDNWLRCWFNSIDAQEVSKKITVPQSLKTWNSVMGEVFCELWRITRPGGWIAFEVGEVRKGSICLDEYVVPLGVQAGFCVKGIVVNAQEFTKTANIWGVDNNKRGTNTNRIVVFQKA